MNEFVALFVLIERGDLEGLGHVNRASTAASDKTARRESFMLAFINAQEEMAPQFGLLAQRHFKQQQQQPDGIWDGDEALLTGIKSKEANTDIESLVNEL